MGNVLLLMYILKKNQRLIANLMVGVSSMKFSFILNHICEQLPNCHENFRNKNTLIHESRFLLACYFEITSQSYFLILFVFDFRVTFWRMKQQSRSCLRLKSCLRRFRPSRRLLYRQRRTLMRPGMATDLWLSIPPFCSSVSLTWPTLSLCTSTRSPGLSTSTYR